VPLRDPLRAELPPDREDTVKTNTEKLDEQFHAHFGTTPPCPVCGAPRKLYIRTTRRGAQTTKGRHRPGERRTRRELRATCGKKRCQTVLRGRSLAGEG
jgi:hypothetical protein